MHTEHHTQTPIHNGGILNVIWFLHSFGHVYFGGAFNVVVVVVAVYRLFFLLSFSIYLIFPFFMLTAFFPAVLGVCMLFLELVHMIRTFNMANTVVFSLVWYFFSCCLERSFDYPKINCVKMGLSLYFLRTFGKPLQFKKKIHRM